MITRDQKISALKREVALRKATYPKRIQAHLMTQEKAQFEIAVMVEILHDYIGPDPDLPDPNTRVTSE